LDKNKAALEVAVRLMKNLLHASHTVVSKLSLIRAINKKDQNKESS